MMKLSAEVVSELLTKINSRADEPLLGALTCYFLVCFALKEIFLINPLIRIEGIFQDLFYLRAIGLRNMG